MLLGGAVLVGSLAGGRTAAAREPTAEDLATGRQLFTQALDDEDHKRFDAALEKYKRVLSIRETASVHYRMGATLEGLGRTNEAIAEYNTAVRLGNEKDKTDAEVMKASKARIDALEPKVAHIAVRVAPSTPPDAEIRVDDKPVEKDKLGDVRVDPGNHVVTVSSSDGRTSRAEVTVPEGGRVELPVTLEPAAPPKEPPPPPSDGKTLRTVGLVTGIAGVALAGTGVIILALRSGAISDLETACPGGNCPASREKELRDTHDTAVTQGPLGGTLIGVGALAVGAGVTLYLVGSKDSKSAPSVTANGTGLVFRGSF